MRTIFPRLERGPQPTTKRGLGEPFSALVFKVQANMDDRHRDNLAFLRICSGSFQRGMAVTNARTVRELSLSYPHQLFGREREIVDRAWPGDVIGVVNASVLRVGDTLYQGRPVLFPPLPRMEPTAFALARNLDAQRYRQFRRGLDQLDGEGLVQLLYRDPADPQPVLGGLGPLQFEAVSERMATEFGVTLQLEDLPWTVARRLDPAVPAQIPLPPGAQVLHRGKDELLIAFRHEFDLRRFVDREPRVGLSDDGAGEVIVVSE